MDERLEAVNSAFKNNNWVEVEKAYRALQSVGEQLLCEHKDKFLQKTQGIAAKVAYALIQEGQLEGAVEALEQGAARLLRSAFADLTQLQQDSPELYKRYQQQLQAVNNARSSYQQAVSTMSYIIIPPCEKVRENEAKKAQTSSEWQTTEEQFNKTLAEIRQLRGHENFLRIDINTVKKVSLQQPLIYIFSTEKGGYALSIFREEIQPIALPKLTEATLSKEMKSYFRIYSAYKTAREEYENTCTGHNKHDSTEQLLISGLKKYNMEFVHESPCKKACDNYKKARNNWFNAIDTMTALLYQVIMQPVLKACDEYKKACQDISHITLIPIGELNLLPLHAACDNKRHYVLEDYTISYAPNALALQTARNRAKINKEKIVPETCLLINNPTKDLCDAEVISIQKYFVDPKKIERKQATKEKVKNELKNDYSVLHFSCHGEVSYNAPSVLLMAKEEYLTVRDFLDTKLNARLVCLSACETGIIGKNLPDEVEGLPTSLLQAGAACVVSSLWSIDTYSTMFLMMKFYEFFKKDNKKPAIALREAQIWLRDATKDKLLGASTEHLKALRKHISSSPPPSLEEKEIERQLNQYKSDKPYEHAYYWAAFYVTGE